MCIRDRNNGLINVLNIPITNNKEIMNVRDSKRRLKVISIMTYRKTIVYNLEKTRGKWEIPEIKIRGNLSTISVVIDGPETYGKTSVISFILDKPETSWFNKQYYKMIQISFETREKITTE